jgi:glycosyltransferase involved in cell wall biosynthesis
MRVHVVDPSAFTPPYDHALCAALAADGLDVDLYTSRFAYGVVAPPDGYAAHEFFYRAARGAPASRLRLATKLAQHVPDMLRYARAARRAEVVHFQWLTVQQLDRHLLPRARPLVLTAHDVLPREPRPGQLAGQRRLYRHFDAVVVHSEHGRARLVGGLGLDPAAVHVIPHGVFSHLTELPSRPLPLPETERPVVLCFGLMRPYKGIDVLLEAWGESWEAELWVVGLPKMDIRPLQAAAAANVRFVPRFITDSELPAYFRRADLVVLPYREIDQSGVLSTALAFGNAIVASDVGGFGEFAAHGAAQLVPPGDPAALREVLEELLRDAPARSRLAAAARAAAAGPYSWQSVARRTRELYEALRVAH